MKTRTLFIAGMIFLAISISVALYFGAIKPEEDEKKETFKQMIGLKKTPNAVQKFTPKRVVKKEEEVSAVYPADSSEFSTKVNLSYK